MAEILKKHEEAGNIISVKTEDLKNWNFIECNCRVHKFSSKVPGHY